MTKAEQLTNYYNNVLKVNILNEELVKLELRLEDTNAQLDKAESINDDVLVEVLSATYNVLNEQRIDLALEKNRIEKELLEFERAASKAE